MSFGKRVLEALDYRGMTREELYNRTGLKSSYLVGYIKNPDRSPTLSTACKIALALDVSLDYLSGLIDEPLPIQRTENSKPMFADPRQRDINNAFESVNEDGKQIMWTNSIMAEKTFPVDIERDDVQKSAM